MSPRNKKHETPQQGHLDTRRYFETYKINLVSFLQPCRNNTHADLEVAWGLLQI